MNKQTVTITRIYRGMGKTKFGEKEKVAIKTAQHGDRWISSFKTKGTEKWAENDTVDVYIEEKNGYLNFALELPQGNANPELEARVRRLEERVFGIQTKELATEPDPLDDFSNN